MISRNNQSYINSAIGDTVNMKSNRVFYMRRFIIIVIFLLPIIACSQKELSTSGPSTSEIMNSWVGHYISEVIRSWGPYQQAIPDGEGGMVYSWQSSILLTPRITGRILTVPIVRQMTFYVRPGGIIYSWHTKGY